MENTNNTKPHIEVITNDKSVVGEGTTKLTLAKPSQSSILTSIHAGFFRISLSLGSQALLWKMFSTSESNGVGHLHNQLLFTTFFLLWCVALLAQVLLFILYFRKCIFHFHLVKEEFLHHIGVNYLYAPSVSWLLLLQSAPMASPNTILHQILFWVFTVPIIILDTKLYGQWFTTERKFLSILANPASQVSVIANLVAARAAALMGWKETAVCLFSLGMVHYLVIFVTLYQRLPGANNFPVTLRPILFLFIAAPSMASLAWNSITGSFDTTSKMLFFLSLFIFFTLICRPMLFKKSMKRFSLTWWAYSFPLNFLALASAQYAKEVKGHIAPCLMLFLSSLSVLVFLSLMLLSAAKSNKLMKSNDPVFNQHKDKDGNCKTQVV